ncbi:MAG: hypothetical protein GQ529_07015 [Methyloprofundus sp.]|nr:hypothetical protein [Methyloprofundus sp.]
MGSSVVVYQAKFQAHLSESFIHLKRLNNAIKELEKTYTFPLEKVQFKPIINSNQDLAFVDQIIYRFSKLQDIMGAKLFKSYLIAQGESVDKPFLDILNQLEKLNILEVDEWFELRDIRNSISHHYEEDEKLAIELINTIYKTSNDLADILQLFKLARV